MPPKQRSRAIIYVRQSAQREESISLELQEKSCRDYCERQRYDVIDVVSDPGVSGLQFAKRPGIRRALARVEAHEAQVVVVYRWSRLSRRQPHQAVILERLEKAGGRVESASEPVDTSTAGGKFSRNVLLAAAEFESQQKSEQWREAQARRVSRGLMPGGRPPFGYMPADKRGEPPIPDPATAPIVKRMYADYLRGHGLQRLALDLNAAGVVSTKGNALSIMTVSRILDSGFAAGYLNLGVNTRDNDGNVIGVPHRERGAHEPIIDEGTWQRYLRARQERRTVHPKARQPKWHLGGGLAVCGRCGGNLVVGSYLAANSQAICSRYRQARTCAGVWIQRASLETAVALWLGGRIDEWADAQDQLQGVDTERAEVIRSMDAVREDLKRLDGGRHAINTQTALGRITAEEADASLAEAERERSAANAQLDELQAKLDLLSPGADVWARLERGMVDQTPEEWNVILKRVIKSVSVTATEVTILPVLGEPATYNRPTYFPPKQRRDRQERAADGRFVSKPTMESSAESL
jgi:DNA invertase Pin-like site-specific DNA recombinase